MADSRATLKAFFNTGDIPTEAQFASLIDSLLSLEDNSNLKNGIKIKSQADGNIQIQISNTDLFITNDGDTFADQFVTMGSFGLNFNKVGFGGFIIDSGVTLTIGWNIRAAGKMAAKGLQTFANNAAALSGGLSIDDVYKTATGEFRIVV